MEKVEGQGPDFTLDNTTDNKFVKFEGSGNTEQEQLQGKNLFDKNNVINAYLNADGTTTENSAYRVSDYIDISNINDLTISGNYGGSEYCCFYDSNKTFVNNFGMGTLTTRTVSVPANAKYIRVTVRANVLDNYQLEKGSTATSYEPYCGGIPAPNSSYEIPVKNVTGDVVNKIQNKNLAVSEFQDKFTVSGQGDVRTLVNSNYKKCQIIKVKPSTQYTIHGDFSGFSDGWGRILQFEEEPKVGSLSIKANAGHSPVTITTLPNTNYILIFNLADADTTIPNLQVEANSTTTTYVTHQEHNYPFTLEQGQRMYKDSYLADDGIHNKMAQSVINITSITTLDSGNIGGIISSTYLPNKIRKSNNYVVCNRAIFNNTRETGTIYENPGNCIIVGTPTDTLQTLQEKYNGSIVEYELSEEAQKTEIIPYNETQQAQYNAMKKAMSYDEQTNISSKSNELGMIIDAEAVTKAYDDTEMIENIEEIKEEQITQNTKIEALQAENTELKKDIANMSKAMLTTKGQGTDFTLNNTTDNKFVEFEGSGNTEQESYEGKNLFDNNSTNYIKRSATPSIIDTGVRITTTVQAEVNPVVRYKTIDITDYENKKFILKAHAKSSSTNPGFMYMRLVDEENNISNSFPAYTSSTTTDGDLQTEITIPSTIDETYHYLSVALYGTREVETPVGSYVDYTNIQLEQGSTATPYEPYTGGIPAPNPSYEIPVKNVTGDVNVKIQNKNLFDFDNTPYSSLNSATIVKNNDKTYTVTCGNSEFGAVRFINNDLKLKPNTTYTFSAKVISTTSSNGSAVYCSSVINKTGQKYGNYVQAGQKSSVTFTTPDIIDGTLLAIGLYPRQSNGTATFGNIQIEEGSTATSYVEHQEQNLPLTLGDIELCKIDTAKDYFFKNVVGSKYYNAELLENKWYLHKEVGKIVLDGSESGWSYTPTTNYYRYHLNKDLGIKEPTSSSTSLKAKIFSPMFVSETMNGTWAGKTGISILIPSSTYNYARLCLCYVSSDTSNSSKFKTWIANNNVPVYYQLATSTNTLVTDTTLEAQLENLYYKSMSYDEQTNISSRSNELGMIIDAEAIQNINNVLSTINSRLDLVEG